MHFTKILLTLRYEAKTNLTRSTHNFGKHLDLTKPKI